MNVRIDIHIENFSNIQTYLSNSNTLTLVLAMRERKHPHVHAETSACIGKKSYMRILRISMRMKKHPHGQHYYQYSIHNIRVECHSIILQKRTALQMHIALQIVVHCRLFLSIARSDDVPDMPQMMS